MENKALLDYGTHPSFPALTLPESDGEVTAKASNWLLGRKKELEQEFEFKAKELYDLAVSTARANCALKAFEPITGKLYFIYARASGDEFMSHIEPHEWTVDTQPYKYIGMFKLNSDGIWNDVTKTEYAIEVTDWRYWSE